MIVRAIEVSAPCSRAASPTPSVSPKRWWPNRRRAPARRRPPRRCPVRREQGRLGESRRPEGLVYQYPTVTVRASLAVLYAEIGRRRSAQAELEPDRRRPRGDPARPHLALYDLVPGPHRRPGDGEAQADALHAALVSVADHHAVASPFFHLGPVAYYLARSRRARRWEGRKRGLRRRALQRRARRSAVRRAHSRRLGSHRARARRRRRRRAAQARLAAAAAIAGRLGMEAMQRKIATASQAAAAAVTPAPHVVLRRDGDVDARARPGRAYTCATGAATLSGVLLREPERFHVLDSPAPAEPQSDLGPGLDAAAAGNRHPPRARAKEDAEEANDPARAGAARSTSSAICHRRRRAPAAEPARPRRVQRARQRRQGVAGRGRTGRRHHPARRRAARGGAPGHSAPRARRFAPER